MVVWYSGPIILPNSPETQMAVHFAYVHEHSLSRIKAISSLCCLICLMCWGQTRYWRWHLKLNEGGIQPKLWIWRGLFEIWGDSCNQHDLLVNHLILWIPGDFPSHCVDKLLKVLSEGAKLTVLLSSKSILRNNLFVPCMNICTSFRRKD